MEKFKKKSYILHWLAQDGSWQREFLKISTNLGLQLLLDKNHLLVLISGCGKISKKKIIYFPLIGARWKLAQSIFEHLTRLLITTALGQEPSSSCNQWVWTNFGKKNDTFSIDWRKMEVGRDSFWKSHQTFDCLFVLFTLFSSTLIKA